MGFLSEVVEATRERIRRADYLTALPTDTAASRRASLTGAIRRDRNRGALLVEYKRVSPGADLPRLPVRTPAEFVAATAPGAVAGYSCIATEYRFEGSVRDVAEVARATERPVLFKDFVIDPIQLEAATLAGASAVLLVARLAAEGLLELPLAELAREAHERRLEVVLEFHHRSELKQAAGVAADVYGVNVRDLDTLRLEPDVAVATIREANDLRPLLGLSGVASPEDARRFWDAGTDGILVGSAAARSPDPGAFLRSLHRSSPEVSS